MLDVGRLRLLLAISEHGGTAGAARTLGRPVAEVSGQVSDAERSLGLALLDGDQLTPAGRRLAEHGGRLLGQLEAAESDAAAVAGRLAGTLRLGVGADAGRVLLADALPALRSAAPELSVHVRQLADAQVGALGSTLDVVVVGEYGTAVPHRADAAVERRELLTEPLLLAVPSRHRATGASVRLAELTGEAWIGGSGDALVALERAAAGAGFAPRLVAEVGEDALALTLVAAGQGVALVPASAAPGPVDGVRFLTVLDGGLRRTVVAAVRRSAIADPGVKRLLEALAAAARRVAAAVPGVSAAVVSSSLPPSAPSSAPSSVPPTGSSRRPDPLFDPLPDASSGPSRNGRRDPWDRVRPETNGSNGLPNGTPFGTDLPGRNGFGGPAEVPDSERPGRNGQPTHGRAAELPGGDLPGRNGVGGSGDAPGRNGFGGPAEGPGRNGFGGPADGPGNGPNGFGAPGARPSDVPGGSLPAPGEPSGRPGIGGPPDAGGDLPPRSGHDISHRGGPSNFGPADLSGPGPLPAPGGDLPGRTPPDFGSLPSAGDLPGRSPADFGSLPPAGGERSDFGGRPPAGGDLPGRGDRSGPGEGRGPSRFEAPSDGRGLPAPGLPAPGAGLPSRGGSSPYRTPPPTGDLPPSELPRLGNELGPNPYRPDASAHPTPDPFRAGGPDQGPNPYRSNGARRAESLGGVELFSASPRTGQDGPPAPRAGSTPSQPRRSRAAARGGDGAEGTLPPAPAGAADNVRLSIFEDLQSEWFVQRDSDENAAPKNQSWQMAADDGWAAAARLAEPTTAGTTTAGLPRRRPQAMAVPGAVGGPIGAEAPPPSTTHRSPQEVRGRLSSYRDGVRRGRHAERPDGEDQ